MRVCKYIFPSSHNNDTGSWNPPSLSHIVNTMAADVIATQGLGAKTSAAMILVYFSWNILVSPLEGLQSEYMLFHTRHDFFLIFKTIPICSQQHLVTKGVDTTTPFN